MYAPTLTYAQMRPPGVESNHFAYHLDQLLREALIAKDGRNYSLTEKGLSLADRVSHESMTVRLQPHIVTSIHLTNDAGQTLLYRHTFQPYLNLHGAPQGRIHYEEHIADAAARELTEKTGLSDVALTHRGMVYIHATKSTQDISKILAHVFTGTVNGTPALVEPTAKGACSWGKTARLAKSQCMPGFKEVQKLLAQHPNELFFAELEVEMGV